MDGGSTKEASLELEPEENHRPFSVVLAPAALVAVQNQQNGGCAALIRHLPVPHSSGSSNSSSSNPSSTEGGRARKQSPARRSSPLSGVVVAVRAQPQVLHLFRGRRLCRVVEFPSPISDFAGLPPGCPRLSSLGLLCVAVCRDGTAYALPIAEVLDAERGGDTCSQQDAAEGRAAGNVDGNSTTVGGDGGPAESTAAVRKQSSSARSSSISAPLGIFEELTPTILGRDPTSSQEQARHQQQRGKGSSSSGGSSGGSGSGGSVGGLVLRVQERWAVFNHLGARTVVAGGGGLTAAAVAGIIDRAAVYGLAGKEGEHGATLAVGRSLASLDGVDGAAPTTSCMVWMEDGRGASGDGKGFSLPSPVFWALFGAELALSQSTPSSSSPPLTRVNDATSGNHDAVSSEPPMQPSVILLGDAAGTVRWAPARPHRGGGSGGVLANLATSIVGVFPQLNAASRAVGVLVVGADGAVLSLTTESAPPPRAAPRKRARRDAAGESGRRDRGGNGGGAGTTSSEDSCRGSADTTEPPAVCQRALKLPFPIASACSAPGFLVHCHAGALFASAVPKGGGEETNRGGGQGRTSGAAHAAPLRPVRLPLPCDSVGVTVAVLAEDEADAAADLSSAILRTLVVSLSARGRLVGFVAPRSAEELEGWALDTGRGGVRVGGTAGVEHRVRCQLERLSSLGRQCAALSTESAERDREIRTLRGATEILPPLVRRSARRRRSGAGQHLREASPPLEHSVVMTPDATETASSEDWCGGTGGFDALRVRLCVRLQWPALGGCSRSLPAAGREGAGRWFIVTRIVADGDEGGSGAATGEGWAWSTSSLLPMDSLRQGRPWRSSVALSLPSARPVTATSWLQFSFGVEGSSGCDGGRGGGGPLDKASGACVELGSSRFDLLDWGVKLSSVPGSVAAVRGAARGRGACFCGPDLVIAEICGTVPSPSGGGSGGGGGGSGGGSGRALGDSPYPWKTAPTTWRSFQLRVASPGCDAGALLGLLMPPSVSPPAAANGMNGAPAPASGATSELAVRVAGQVAVIRTRDDGAGLVVEVGGGVGAAGGAGGQTDPRTVEIWVTCSHEAMSPLVREALLRRASALAALKGWGEGEGFGDGGGGGGGGGKANAGPGEAFGGDLLARGDAAARLVRQIHPIGRAVGDLGDAARALGAARASDGPSVETAKEALALMYRVGEVYQALRRQQEGASAVV
ncbi:unnamed protein product [Laminaria digitata]